MPPVFFLWNEAEDIRLHRNGSSSRIGRTGSPDVVEFRAICDGLPGQVVLDLADKIDQGVIVPNFFASASSWPGTLTTVGTKYSARLS